MFKEDAAFAVETPRRANSLATNSNFENSMLLTSSFVLPSNGKKRPWQGPELSRSLRRRIVSSNHPLEYTVTIPGGRRSSCLKYMYEILDEFETADGTGASLQTLELATSLFDRYMAFLNQPLVDRDELELLCVACVSLATKFHEVQSYLLTEPYYANDAERDRVVEMEGRVLASIEWNVRLKDSLVEKVFDAAVPGNDRNHRSVVRRAFQSVWRHMYFLQGFSSAELTGALASIVAGHDVQTGQHVEHFCTRQILRAATL